MQSPSRVLNGFRFAADGKVEDLLPTLFNAAFPSMILKNLGDGESVCLHGVSETGPVRFSIPSSGLIVRLQFDDEVIERELAVDQLGIEVDKSRVFIAYRYPFRYILYPLQRRSCELRVKQ